jgi:hypothetical protein
MDLGEEIGHGAYGHVHIHKKDESLCIKMSNKQNDINHCRQWSNEYKKIKNILEVLDGNKDYQKLDLVRLIKPVHFVESDTLCYMTMNRIFRAKKINNEEDTGKNMIHPLLGHKNINYTHGGKGLMLGLKHIKNEYYGDNSEELERACYELGVMMGLLHYSCKCNAFDIEVFFGREYGTRKNRFYIGDFDLTSPVTDYHQKEIQEMYCSINDISYFPRPSVDKNLYHLFYNGYSSIVPKNIVEKVFSDYT